MTSTFGLHHEIRLTIEGELGKHGITRLADFLAEAMDQFWRPRDAAAEPLHAGPFRRRYTTGRRQSACFELSRAAPAPASHWYKAAGRAYTDANTLEQIIGQYRSWRKKTPHDGGFMDELLGHIEKGDLVRAFARMHEESAGWELEQAG